MWVTVKLEKQMLLIKRKKREQPQISSTSNAKRCVRVVLWLRRPAGSGTIRLNQQALQLGLLQKEIKMGFSIKLSSAVFIMGNKGQDIKLKNRLVKSFLHEWKTKRDLPINDRTLKKTRKWSMKASNINSASPDYQNR